MSAQLHRAHKTCSVLAAFAATVLALGCSDEPGCGGVDAFLDPGCLDLGSPTGPTTIVRHDVTVELRDLDDHVGQRLVIHFDSPTPAAGLIHVTSSIPDGSFEVSARLREGRDYVVTAWIDHDEDRACDAPDEPAWRVDLGDLDRPRTVRIDGDDDFTDSCG